MNERCLDAYGDEYEKLPFEKHQAHLRRLELLGILNTMKPRRVAEIGCGSVPLFLDYNDFDHMTVVEPARIFAEKAAMMASSHANSASIQIIPKLLEDVEPQEKEFDLVILSCLLHELPFPQNVLKQAIRLGGSSCQYLLIVPNANSFHRQLGYRSGMIAAVTQLSDQQIRLQQSRTYTAATFREELDQSGLVPELEKTIIFKPFTHSQMQRLLDDAILTEDQVYAMAGMVDLAPDCGSELLVIAKCKTQPSL